MVTDAQREALKGHVWKLVAHLNFGGGKYAWSYRCATLGCNKTAYVQGGAEDTTYFIDGDERQFDSIEELVTALQEKGLLVVAV